ERRAEPRVADAGAVEPRPRQRAGSEVAQCSPPRWIADGRSFGDRRNCCNGGKVMATTPAAPKTNRLGLAVLDYRGSKTTLCAGCGHNAISERIIDAMFEMGVQPE